MPPNIDALLEPILLAASDEQADSSLSQVITHVVPVIKGVIRYKLHFSSYAALDNEEADDVLQEVNTQLLAELQKFRRQPTGNAINDVRGLAAVIAHRACARWMRRQFPERHAFKNRLHYLLTRQNGLPLWRTEDGKLMAGFAVWRGQKKANKERLKSLSDDTKLVAQVRLLQAGKHQPQSGAILAAIFNYLGGPTEFDELISTLSEILNIRTEPIESADENENAISVATGEVDTAWRIEKRIFLERLWEEVRQLPPNQIVALLLNLRDAEGRGCIALFQVTGIATIRQLAETLQMSAENFSELWNELPLDDTRIGEFIWVDPATGDQCPEVCA